MRVWSPKCLRDELEQERGRAMEYGRRLESVELLGVWSMNSVES